MDEYRSKTIFKKKKKIIRTGDHVYKSRILNSKCKLIINNSK